MAARFLILSLSFFWANSVLARPLLKEDEHYEWFIASQIYISKDFKTKFTTRLCRTLLDDSDEAMALGTQQNHVDRSVTTRLSIKAWTEVDGKIVDVPPANIHHGKGSVSLQGFSDIEVDTFTFDNVKAGAKLCYETVDESIAGLEGYIEIPLSVVSGIIQKGSNTRIESEIPLEVKTKNLDTSWQIKGHKGKDKEIYTIEHLRDATYGFAFEELTDWDWPVPMIIFRSHTALDAPPLLNLNKKVENLLAEPLPAHALAFIAALKKKGVTEPRQIATEVMAWAQDNVRYMGDWRSREGHFVPRPLGQIFESKYGDCKDFSLLTIALLRSLGLKAHFTLIQRGVPNASIHSFADSLYLMINHAVVYVAEASEGDAGFLIDPTNVMAFPDPLWDLLDRNALVITEKPFVHHTKTWAESKSYCEQTRAFRFIDNNSAWFSFSSYLSGVEGAMTAQSFFRNSPEVNKDMLRSSFNFSPTELIVEKMPEFWDRKAATVEIKFSGSQQGETHIATPLGKVLALDQPYLDLFRLQRGELRLSNIRLPLERGVVHKRFQRTKLAHSAKSLNGKLVSKWFTIERKVKQEGDDLVITTAFETLIPTITTAEFISHEFSELDATYRRLFFSQGAILQSR